MVLDYDDFNIQGFCVVIFDDVVFCYRILMLQFVRLILLKEHIEGSSSILEQTSTWMQRGTDQVRGQRHSDIISLYRNKLMLSSVIHHKASGREDCDNDSCNSSNSSSLFSFISLKNTCLSGG